jgi:hypothetical protein
VAVEMEVVSNKTESAAAPGFTSWNVTVMPGTTYAASFKAEVMEVAATLSDPLRKIIEFTPPASETTPHTIVFKLAGVVKSGNEVPIVPPGGGDTFTVKVFKATPDTARVTLAAPTLDFTNVARSAEVRLAFNLPTNQLDQYLNAHVPGYSSALNSNDFRILLADREGKEFVAPSPATVSGTTVGMQVNQKMLTDIMKLTDTELKAGGEFKIKCKVLLPARISDAEVTPTMPPEIKVIIPKPS